MVEKQNIINLISYNSKSYASEVKEGCKLLSISRNWQVLLYVNIFLHFCVNDRLLNKIVFLFSLTVTVQVREFQVSNNKNKILAFHCIQYRQRLDNFVYKTCQIFNIALSDRNSLYFWFFHNNSSKFCCE